MGKREGSFDGRRKEEEGVVGGLRVDVGLMGKEGVKADDRSGGGDSSEEDEEGRDDGGDGDGDGGGHLLRHFPNRNSQVWTFKCRR